MRRVIRLMEAMMSQALEEAMVASQSLARRSRCAMAAWSFGPA